MQRKFLIAWEVDDKLIFQMGHWGIEMSFLQAAKKNGQQQNEEKMREEQVAIVYAWLSKPWQLHDRNYIGPSAARAPFYSMTGTADGSLSLHLKLTAHLCAIVKPVRSTWGMIIYSGLLRLRKAS